MVLLKVLRNPLTREDRRHLGFGGGDEQRVVRALLGADHVLAGECLEAVA